jgi:hypothetical protein
MNTLRHLTEQYSEDGRVIGLMGVFGEIGISSISGKGYSEVVWQKLIDEFASNPDSFKFLVSLDLGGKLIPTLKVDPMEACGKVNALWLDGKYLKGQIDLFEDNQYALLIKVLVCTIYKKYVCSHIGYGLYNERTNMVDDNYSFVQFIISEDKQ